MSRFSDAGAGKPDFDTMIDVHALLTRWPEVAAKATELGLRAAANATELGLRAAANAQKLASEVERDARGVAEAAVAFARCARGPSAPLRDSDR